MLTKQRFRVIAITISGLATAEFYRRCNCRVQVKLNVPSTDWVSVQVIPLSKK